MLDWQEFTRKPMKFEPPERWPNNTLISQKCVMLFIVCLEMFSLKIPTLSRSIGTTMLFQYLCKCPRVVSFRFETVNNCCWLAFTNLDFTPDPNDAVMYGWGPGFRPFTFAGAVRKRPLTFGPDPAGYRRVNRSWVFHGPWSTDRFVVQSCHRFSYLQEQTRNVLLCFGDLHWIVRQNLGTFWRTKWSSNKIPRPRCLKNICALSRSQEHPHLGGNLLGFYPPI